MSAVSPVRSVAVATVLVAAAGYLIVFLAARVLGPAVSGVFMVFWSALYLAIGTVFGLQQESTRAVRTSLNSGHDSSMPRTSIAAACAGAIIATIIAGTSPFWAFAVFGTNALLFTGLVVAGTLLYSGHAAIAGSLAGLGRWTSFSVLLVTEAVVRAGMFGVVIATVQAVPWLAIVSVAATGVWIPLLAQRSYRAAANARSDARLGLSVSRMLQGGVAAASSAVLITGFPVLLSITGRGENPALVGVVILVVTLTRGPILVPLNAFLGMLVTRFVDDPSRSMRPVLRPIAYLLAATCLVAGVTFFVGEALFVFVLGEDYRIEGAFIAGCVFAAGLIGSMNITGAAVLARGFHASYSIAWLIAAISAGAILLVPVPLEVRVVIALSVGPAIGIAIHLTTLRVRRPAATG